MWCGRKGIDCEYCGVFGECRSSGYCSLQNAKPSTLGTSSTYLVETKYEKPITDIRYDAIKEFAERLKMKAWQGYQIGMYIVSTQQIDELLDELLEEYEQ